jgi:predicted nucleic acid-binding protein
VKQKRMARKRKVKRFVIDVNSFFTLFINRETDWLLQYILKNNFEILADRNLINELLRVLDFSRIKKLLPPDKEIYTNFVLLINTHIKAENFNIQSPGKSFNSI